jgi:hypothetical protein
MSENKPAGWKNYEDFAAGIATNRLPATDALVSATCVCHWEGERLDLTFLDTHCVAWKNNDGQGSDWYEAIEVCPHTYFVDMTFAAKPREALSLVFNTESRRLLAIRTVVRERPVAGEPQVGQTFLVGWVGDDASAATSFVPAPTRDLIGLRAIYTYSPNHTYEHVYLSSERYCWQCLVGEQRGHSDVDLATTYKFAENQYLFTFREFIIPVASVFFFDFEQMRSTGKFLGVTKDGAIENNPAGAYIQKASMTFYPRGAEPV